MNPPNIPFILNIGVTGHRKIEDVQNVSKAVSVSLVTIITSFELDQKTALILNIISPIAEGADRIVANEALKLENKYDVKLKVVLPFIIEEYVKDFSGEESLQEFDNLFKRADEVICICENPFDTSLSKEKLSYVRNNCYQKTGKYVVDHSDLIIAIWDHKPAKGTGGTAEIVKYARELKKNIILINPITFEVEKYITRTLFPILRS